MQTLTVTLSESIGCQTVGNKVHINLKAAYLSLAGIFDGYIVATVTDFVKTSAGSIKKSVKMYDPCSGCVVCKSVLEQAYTYTYTLEYEDDQTNPAATLITEEQIDSYCCISCVDTRTDVQILTQLDELPDQANLVVPPVGTKFWVGTSSFTNTLDRPATTKVVITYPSIRISLSDSNKAGVGAYIKHRIDKGPGMLDVGNVHHDIRDSQVDAGLIASSIWFPPSTISYTEDIPAGGSISYDFESEVIEMDDDAGAGVGIDFGFNKESNSLGPVIDILAIGRNN